MKKSLALLLVFVMLTGLLSACGNEPSVEPAEPTTTTRPATTSPSSDKLYNSFTGNFDLEKEEGSRPIAIMVPNDSKVLGYQIGIDRADFYFEAETEGGIPRIMTVFANVYRVPDKYGPVRSARSPFVLTAREFDTMYVHAGGSTKALSVLGSGVVDRFNALKYNNWSWRDDYLKSTLDTEHSLVLSGSKLAAAAEKQGWEKEPVSSKLPFTFGQKAGSGAGNKAQVSPSANKKYTTTWVYDTASGLYTKNMGTVDSHKALKTLDGKKVTVSNVVVLYGEKFVEQKNKKYTWYDFKTGDGTGYIISGGTSRPIKFTRTEEALTLTEEDGTPLTFANGKTYMYLADKSLEAKLVLQ